MNQSEDEAEVECSGNQLDPNALSFSRRRLSSDSADRTVN